MKMGTIVLREEKGGVKSRGLRERGFTLIEIMVVMVIIAILAGMIVPRVMNRPDQARKLAARQDVASLVQALKLYRLDVGRYPTTEQGLMALVKQPAQEPVPGNWMQTLDTLPKDPWGHPYHYANPGQHGEIDVWSLGADGQPGGEGNDADIGNWDS